ncbi:response regulator [Dyadobacter arcticus]|uniref:CheY-like chemotaxis protein n=1 Tax=Dyadobacter arcticus TaxID=1078754 RepID=A0ABX0UL43_9BACT|nr:response regulator [Dyadobacter arcticus]NIJ53731.1 CheY-like chemotaxis protein [Dyadobacter arcticus]
MKEKKAVILIVEDEGIQAMGLEETLEQAGYSVAGVSDNGLDVLEFVRTGDIDLIVMDIHIKGDLDGIQTARKVQEIKPNMPIIYLTAYVDPETTRRAEDTSPAAYITKPYRQVTLLSCVANALQRPEIEG